MADYSFNRSLVTGRRPRWMRDVRTKDILVYGYHTTWAKAMEHAHWAIAAQGGRWEVRRNRNPKNGRLKGYTWYARRTSRWWQL